MRLALTFTAFLVTATPARFADAYNWATNGSSCVPDNSAIQTNRYLNTGGSTKHQSTATGDIIVYCPIPAPDALFVANNKLFVTYSDSDGNGTVANVTAQLIRLSHADGSLTMIGSRLDSNSLGPTTGGEMSESLPAVSYNGFDYFYVRVDISRTSTAQSATFFGLSIKVFP